MEKHMPVIFVAHGSPSLTDDLTWVNELRQWAQTLSKPKAILIVSAHWEHKPVSLGSTQTVPLIYDFYGFPEPYYHVQYPAPGAPETADRVRALLKQVKISVGKVPKRGLDHGAYIPLLCMYPKADLPVLQVSMPSLDPNELYKLGKALAPLRSEDVLIIGSGFLVHNLPQGFQTNTPQWAIDFDGWIAGVIQRNDVDSLLQFETKAPQVALAHPTYEHLAPIFFCAGAAGLDFANCSFPIQGFWQGTFSKRSVQFG